MSPKGREPVKCDRGSETMETTAVRDWCGTDPGADGRNSVPSVGRLGALQPAATSDGTRTAMIRVSFLP
jgi:hypothetical protein